MQRKSLMDFPMYFVDKRKSNKRKKFNIEEMSQKFDVSAGLQIYFVVELTCNAISLLIRAFCSRHHELKAVIKYF